MARGDVDKFWRKSTYVDLGDGICVRIYKTNTRKPHANTIHYAFNDDAAKFSYIDLPEDLTLARTLDYRYYVDNKKVSLEYMFENSSSWRRSAPADIEEWLLASDEPAILAVPEAERPALRKALTRKNIAELRANDPSSETERKNEI